MENKETIKESKTQRWGILYCPKHTVGHNHKRWERIERQLQEAGVEYDFVQSESPKSVTRLMGMLVSNGYQTIVIVGGDTALNDAVNCLMSQEKEVRSQVRLGLIPNGTLNDFAHFWGIREGDLRGTISSLKAQRTRSIDLGCIHYTNDKGNKEKRYFLNCVNVGFIASIMRLKQRTRKVLGSKTLSFVFSVLLLVFQKLEYKMHLKINSDAIQRKIMTVCVGNALGYGQTPNAVPYNGLLDVSVVCHPELMSLLEGLYLLFTGRFLNHRSVHPYRSEKVEFLNTSNALVSLDGKVIGTPQGGFTVTVEQEVVNFIIPA